MEVEELINLKKENIIVDEYTLKLTMLSMYGPSLVYNLRMS